MMLPTLWGHLQRADEAVCEALDTARRMAQDGTWQDCAETTEIEALLYLANLLTLRQDLLALQRRANSSDIPQEEAE